MSKDWIGGKSSIRTLAASNQTENEREERDYYATDPMAGRLLLELEPDLHDIWECASSGGHLADVFAEAGKLARKSDIVDRTGDTEVLDFLSITNGRQTLFGNEIPPWHGSIVTNPPYRYAGEFIRTALSVVADGELVCMFLPVRYLEGKERRALFDSTPPLYGLCVIIPHTMRHERRVRQDERVFGKLLLDGVEERLQGRYTPEMVQLKNFIFPQKIYQQYLHNPPKCA